MKRHLIMKRALFSALIVASLAAAAGAVSDARPPQINNSAAPQVAEYNVSTGTVRGPMTVGSLKISGGPTYDANNLPGMSPNSTNYIHNDGSSSAPSFTVNGATVTGNGWTMGQIFAGPSQLSLTTADGHTDATNLFGALPALNGSSLTGLTKSQVGLGNVLNLDQTNADNLASGTLAVARTPALTGAITKSAGSGATAFGWQVSASSGIQNGTLPTGVIAQTVGAGAVGVANISASGSPSASTYLRGDNVWATPPTSGDMLRSVFATNGAAGIVDKAVAVVNQVSLSTGITGVTPIANGGTGAISASTARTALGVVPGIDVEAHDTDLTALAGISSTGFLAHTGAGSAAARTLTANTTYVVIVNGDGAAGNPTIDVVGVVKASDINSLPKLEQQVNFNILSATEPLPAANLTGILPALDGGSLANLTPANLAAGTAPNNVQVSSVSLDALYALLLAGSNVSITKTISGIQISATGAGGAPAVILSTGGVQMSTGAAQIDFRQQHFNIKLVNPGVYQVEIASGAATTAILADDAVTLAKLYKEASVSVGQVYSAGTSGGIVGLTPLTTFYDLERYGTPDFGLSTANNYDASASTNPYFGRMRFDGSASSTTNCGIYDSNIAPNDFNQTIDPRLNQFVVKLGTATDNAAQRYVLRVAAIADDTKTLTLPFTASVNIDVPAGAGSNALANRAMSAPVTLTGWGAIIVPGMPYAVEVCRAGADATNDPSGIDSFMVGWQTRYAHTQPGN